MAFDYDYSHRLDDIMAQIERDEAKEPPAPNLPEAGNAVTARFVFNNGTAQELIDQWAEQAFLLANHLGLIFVLIVEDYLPEAGYDEQEG